MKRPCVLLVCIFVSSIPALGQSSGGQSALDAEFKISLPAHSGQLQWHADGFKIIETSAKSNGQEIGLRGKDGSGRLAFLGFLFLVPEKAPLSSAKCRDGALAEQKNNPTLKILATLQVARSEYIPIALATYSTQGRNAKKVYTVRGFVGAEDICGDLEFYSETAISAEDPDLRKIFESYRLDPSYIPQFRDALLYAQILYQHQMYKAAAPIFEQALSKLDDNKAKLTLRRVTTDQAGMSYGMSGDIPKARALFEAAIAKDPDYPMYYYNLACADAEQKKLADARVHLKGAFARKGNMIPGEKLPDPTKDDSFLPYRNDKDFWTFLEELH
jgi:tetratricopeptide (TPR) repeat protein